MLLDIVKYPDPRLKLICEPVTQITEELKRLADDMLETMYKAPGVGLAAPQVGRSIRMLVMDDASGEDAKNPRVLFNPVLSLSGDDVLSEREGCLSVPMNYRADVVRKSDVHLTAMGIDGEPIDEHLTGFSAIIAQHETDHLDGILFIDRISRLRRSLYDSRLRKWLKRRNRNA